MSSPWYREYEISYSNLGDMVYAPFMVPNVPGTASEGMHPVPCLVGLHGMFSNSANQFWSIADFCAKRGIAVMTPSLPYHHKRTKNALYVQGLQLIIGSPGEVRDNLRRAVIDTRRALDWLATRSDIDQNCISIAGVSLGGIVASLAFKVEPRFANGVLVVSGSGAGGILENGDTAILNIFRAAAKANVVDPEDFVDALQIVDPINVPDLQPRPVLVMNGMSDVIMVPENAVRLVILSSWLSRYGPQAGTLSAVCFRVSAHGLPVQAVYEISVFRSWHSCRCGPGISLHGRGKCA